jgi:hypothetical protein
MLSKWFSHSKPFVCDSTSTFLFHQNTFYAALENDLLHCRAMRESLEKAKEFYANWVF